MLNIESVSKRFRGGNYGVRDLSLSAKAGVLGLLGPNGAGKTTLMLSYAVLSMLLLASAAAWHRRELRQRW